MALWKAPKRLINGFYNRSFKIRSKWGQSQSRLLGCVECWVDDCFILYTAAVAALQLFIPSSPTNNHNQEMPPSPTRRPPRSFHHSMEMETPSLPTLRAIFRSTYRSQSHVSLYRPIMLWPCGKVGSLQQSDRRCWDR